MWRMLLLVVVSTVCSQWGARSVVAESPANGTAVDAIGDSLPENALMRLGTLRFRPATHVNDDIALSPDESSLVTLSQHLVVWETATGKERWRVPVDEAGIENRGSCYGSRVLAFSSESSRFFTCGPHNEVVIWETATGNKESISIPSSARMPKDRRSGTSSIDVTPDGETLAVGWSRGIVVWNVRGERLFEIENAGDGDLRDEDSNDRLYFGGDYSYARFSPDGSKLAAVTSDRPQEIRLYETTSGDPLQTFALAGRLVRLEFSPDGKRLVTTERDNAVRLYDMATGDQIWSRIIELTNIYENYTSEVVFSPDGRTIAAGATDNHIYLLNSSTGENLGRLTGHHWYPWGLAFTRDSRMLYSAGWDGTIRRWDIPNRQQLPPPAGRHGSAVIAASPDGKTLACQDDANAIHLVDITTGVDRRTIDVPGVRFSQLLFSPDGRYLAGGGSGGDQVRVEVWDATTGEQYRVWSWPKGRDPHSQVESLSFTPDGGKLAAAVFRQSAVYVWDVAQDQQLTTLKHGAVYGLSFSPDGATLATAGWDKRVRLWDTDGWEVRNELAITEEMQQAGDMRMYAVCYAPTGNLIATAHMDGQVRIWDADQRTLRTQFQVKNGFIYGAMSFSPDGLWIATGSSAGNVELWEPLTGQQVWGEGKHEFYLYTVGFGRDSRTLVSGSDDGLGYLWDLQPAGERSEIPDLAALWRDLAGEDAAAAYRAMWGLTDAANHSVPLIAEKLRLVTSVFPPFRASPDLSAEETARQKRLRRLLVDKTTNVEDELTVRRAISVLSQIDTPEAIGLLEELAADETRGKLRRWAAAALHRQIPMDAAP